MILALIYDKYIEIDEEITNHTKLIQSTFKEFHNELDKREKKLIEKLHTIANNKKNKLKNIEKTLNQQATTSQQVNYYLFHIICI